MSDVANEAGGDLLIEMVLGALRAAALRDDRSRRFVLDRLETLRAELNPAVSSAHRARSVAEAERLDVEPVAHETGEPRLPVGPAAPAPGIVAEADGTPPPAPPPEPEPIVSTVLRLGDQTRPVSVRGSAAEADAAAKAAAAPAPRPVDPAARAFEGSGEHGGQSLSVVIDRAELKADACRWAAAEADRLASGEDGAIGYRALITRAKSLPHCHVWMVDPKLRWMRPGLRDLHTLANCYDALADACRLVVENASAPWGTDQNRPLWYLAEAQSALRAAIAAAQVETIDSDQRDAFLWLKHETAERGLFIDRHMKLDDPADPEKLPDLRERIAAARRERAELDARRKARSNRVNKVRYHAGRVSQHLQAATPSGLDEAREEWRRLADAIEQAVAEDHVPPSDAQLRDAVRPVLNARPDEPLGPGVLAVLDAIEDYESSLDPEEASDEVDTATAESPHVRDAAELLRGTTVALIGGLPRLHAKRKLERAFELDELSWLSSRSHQSFYDFEPAIAREDTSAVLLAIRWSSHGFAEVKELCERYGKPLVRLPGGYNPEQVALQVLQQARKQLEARRQQTAAVVNEDVRRA